MKFYEPEKSEWKCYLTGDTVYHPMKGAEPNRFHRFIQRLLLGFKWVKSTWPDKEKNTNERKQDK